jgi:hypothetical protein
LPPAVSGEITSDNSYSRKLFLEVIRQTAFGLFQGTENKYMTDEQTERLQMRVSKEFIQMVDAWRRKQEDLPSRSEATRRLVELGLKVKK